MPQDPIDQLSTERLAKQLSDIIRNRVTLAITILNHLRDGKNVDKRLIDRAICDLKAIAKEARTTTSQSTPQTTRKPDRTVTPGSSRLSQ